VLFDIVFIIHPFWVTVINFVTQTKPKKIHKELRNGEHAGQITVSTYHNYWVSGLCHSSGILNIRKHNALETGSVSIFKLREGTPTQLGPSETANLNH
jgi:hypothetical protein